MKRRSVAGSTRVSRTHDAGDVLHQVSGIADRFAPLILAIVAALFLLGTAGRASQKLLWHDEMFTLYVLRVPRLRDVWTALLAGSDGTPPLFHALIRASVALFGEGLIALRVPSMLGFLGATLCLYVFVARRCGRVFGVLASVLPIVSNAYIYAYEARAYGVVLGCAGVAFVLWQAAAAGVRRMVTVPLLFVSLSAAVAVHYFAVLLLIPLGIGELTRMWQRRRADWPVWCALVGALGPLLVLRPLIRVAGSVPVGRFSQVSSRMVVDQYQTVLASFAIPALIALVLLAIVRVAVRFDRDEADGESPVHVPAHEWLAMIGLLALPLYGAAVGRFVTGAFMPRYALSWILGFSVLSAYTAAVFRPARIVGIVLMAVFAAWAVVKEAPSARLLTHAPPTIARTNATLLADRDGTLPIGVTHAHVYLPLAEYAPPELARRVVMLTQPARLDRQLGGASGDSALYGLATWVPLHLQDFDVFVRTHRRFLLYGPPMWLAGELRAGGARLELRGEDYLAAPFAMSAPESVFLYEVSFD